MNPGVQFPPLKSWLGFSGCGCQVGEITSHFRNNFSGDWDVHWGLTDLDFDPWPYKRHCFCRSGVSPFNSGPRSFPGRGILG